MRTTKEIASQINAIREQDRKISPNAEHCTVPQSLFDEFVKAVDAEQPSMSEKVRQFVRVFPA